MEELKNIAPRLSQLPKKDAFSAPEGYFDDLPSLIQDRVIAESKGKSRVFSPAWTFGSLGLAAVLCLVFLIGKSPDDTTITKQEVAAYVNENIDQEFDETLLAEEYTAIQNKKTSVQSDASLEEYILNQDIDEQLLREEI